MRVAGYIRVSTEQQRDEGSHHNQRERLESWADREGHDIDIYQDIAISGQSDDRDDRHLALVAPLVVTVPSALVALLVVLSLSCLAGIGLLWTVEPAYHGLRDVAGWTTVGGVAAELAVAMLVFLLPTLVMGATFAHLAQRLRDQRDRLGYAVALNTLGAAIAPLVFGVIVLPAVGAKLALVGVSVGYLALIPPGRRLRYMAAGPPAAAAAALLIAPLDLRFVTVPGGGDIVTHRDGVMAAVTVVGDDAGHRYLKVNDEFRMGGTAATYSDRRQAHLPLMLHPDPRRALFLGLGTGSTLAGVLDHPDLVADGVELVPEVVDVMPYFDDVLAGLRSSKRVRIVVADARRFVRATERRYDVIVADVYHPSRDGAGALYTVEHFAAIRERLAPGGLFCQWLPLYQLELHTLQTIVRSFLAVFPHATAHIAHYSLVTPMLCLVGGAGPRRLPPDWFAVRETAPRLSPALQAIALDDEFALFGTFVAGADDLAAFAGKGPLNTDDRPVVMFLAPKAVYGILRPPWGRLRAVIEAATPEPGDVVASAGGLGQADAEALAFGRRLSAYWRARDAFLAVGTSVTRSADVSEMFKQVGMPLLSIVRISPDFEPAYRPLLALARRLAPIDRDAAGELLRDLHRANPQRDDARRLYARLFRQPPRSTSGSDASPFHSNDRAQP